jgi:hypothetical protein
MNGLRVDLSRLFHHLQGHLYILNKLGDSLLFAGRRGMTKEGQLQ